MILTSWEEDALRKGRQEGIKVGKQEGMKLERRRATREIARKMIDKKMDLKTISEITGEPLNELKKLASK